MQESHYLKTELFAKLQNEPRIFEWIESGSVDGIWYWDLVDGEQEWLSPRFKATFGYAEHEIPHTSAWWQDNIHPEDLSLALENFTKHVEDPSHPYDQIVRYMHKNGSLVWVRCRGLVIRDEADTPVRMLGVHTDVTELKRAELALERKTEALERSNDELTRFAYIASHDLKSPINAISQILNWIDEDCGDELPDKAKTFLAQIKARNKRMVTLLNDLLSYSTMEGYSDIVEWVAVKPTIEEMFDTLNVGKHFSLNISDAKIRVQRVPFELVMRNLLSNAFKHHDNENGIISVRVESNADNYTVSVCDDGPGIPQRYHSKIFDMFQTLKPKDQTEGSGLGLSMVQKTLVAIGGSISVSEIAPRGSCFTVTLPKT